jgi:hypothetical protein
MPHLNSKSHLGLACQLKGWLKNLDSRNGLPYLLSTASVVMLIALLLTVASCMPPLPQHACTDHANCPLAPWANGCGAAIGETIGAIEDDCKHAMHQSGRACHTSTLPQAAHDQHGGLGDTTAKETAADCLPRPSPQNTSNSVSSSLTLLGDNAAACTAAAEPASTGIRHSNDESAMASNEGENMECTPHHGLNDESFSQAADGQEKAVQNDPATPSTEDRRAEGGEHTAALEFMIDVAASDSAREGPTMSPTHDLNPGTGGMTQRSSPNDRPVFDSPAAEAEAMLKREDERLRRVVSRRAHNSGMKEDTITPAEGGASSNLEGL